MVVSALLWAEAADAFRSAGDPLAAAVAYLERGAALLELGRGEELPALASRIRSLTVREGASDLAFLRLSVFSVILAAAPRNAKAFLELVRELRRARGGTAPGCDGEDPGSSGTPLESAR